MPAAWFCRKVFQACERPRLTTIEGQPPSLMDLPVGCRFASRCALVEQRCLDAYPGSVRVGEEHTADC
jgi:oligopeptide/dipeptide ABC transporter ATP-binding protein